jgi:hypothetical protein
MKPCHVEESSDRTIVHEAVARALNRRGRPVRRSCSYCVPAGTLLHSDWWTMPADEYPPSVLLCARCGYTTCFDYDVAEAWDLQRLGKVH